MKYIIQFSLLLILNSCCHVNDNRVPTGYPFDPNIIELNYLYYTDVVGAFEDLKTSDIISDTATCLAYFNRVKRNLGYNINFQTYDLIRVSKSVRNVDFCDFQVRVLSNTKEKTYSIDIRTTFSACYDNNFVKYDGYLLVPKIPKDYMFIPYSNK